MCLNVALETQAAWIITIEGRSIYVQDWVNGFLARCFTKMEKEEELWREEEERIWIEAEEERR